MIDAVIRYLHRSLVPFRLTSRPSAEPYPQSAFRVPEGGVLVDTALLRVGRAVVIACYPAREKPDFAALRNLLGDLVVSASPNDFPDSLRGATGPVPPLGQLFELPLVVDTRVSEARVVVFRAFGEDYVEIAYDDLARLEQPRVGSFAFGGELGARGSAEVQASR
jgi:prolyl-tRNA editing enzyme YbaK/EbsC (Cys-tRNA(Pro) deacylase)